MEKRMGQERIKTLSMKSVLNKQAFTLFELIVVVILIGIIYGVFVDKLATKPHQRNDVTLPTIKEFLEKFAFKKSARVVCNKECKQCYVYVDDTKVDASFELFTSEPTVYTLDETGRQESLTFTPRFDKEDKLEETCFEYKIFKNGGADTYIVSHEDTFYVFKTLEKKPKIFTSMNEAVEFFDHKTLLPLLTSDYQHP
jgi:prepilin-type N-terminal cleavage/methylation domain-containing protein